MPNYMNMPGGYGGYPGTHYNTGPPGNGFTGVPTGGGESTSQSSSSQQSSSNPVQTAQSQLSLLISQLAQKYGDQIFKWAQGQVAPNTALTDQVVGNYLRASNLAMQGANNTNYDYNSIYRPEQQQLANLAGSYGSAARAQVNAGQAAANSVQGTQSAIDQSLSQLQSYGVNPSAGSFGALMAAQKTAQGAAAAAAGTNAALGTQAQGRQLLQTSVGVGEQLPGMTTNFLNSAAAGNSGAASTQFGNTSTQAGAFNAAQPFYGTAQNMVGPSMSSQSSGSSQSSSQSQNYTQGNVPQNGPHYIGASGGAIPEFEDGGMAPDTSAPQPFETDQWGPNGGAQAPYGDQNFDNGGPSDGFGQGPAQWQQPQAGPPGGSDFNALDPANKTSGGHVDPMMSPSHGAITDDVNAHVNSFEFVIPKDVALWVGQKKFQNEILKARQEMAVPGLARPSVAGAPPGGNGAQFKSAPVQGPPPSGGSMPTGPGASMGAIPA